jgi:hypothetical protein
MPAATKSPVNAAADGRSVARSGTAYGAESANTICATPPVNVHAPIPSERLLNGAALPPESKLSEYPPPLPPARPAGPHGQHPHESFHDHSSSYSLLSPRTIRRRIA